MFQSVNFIKFDAQEEDKIMKEVIKELLKFQAALAKNTTGEILNEATELYKTAQHHNKKVTEILMERNSEAYFVDSIHISQEDLYTSKDYTNLHGLVRVLQSMKSLLKK